MEYNLWDTAKYAMAFLAPNWLNSSRHAINPCTPPIEHYTILVCNAFELYTMEYPTRYVYFLGIHTFKPLGECVYHENTSEKWDIPWYTTGKYTYYILSEIKSQGTMGRLNLILSNIQQLSCSLIGYIL